MKLKCFTVKADQINKNGRMYSREILQHSIDEYMKNPHKFGTASNDQNYKGDIDLAKVSHEIKSISIEDDNSLVTEIKLLDTPQGNLYKQYIRNCHCVPFGIGRVDSKTGNVYEYKLIAMNIQYLTDNEFKK